LEYLTRYYVRVGALNWQGVPNYAVLGSTLTSIPPVSSGTVTTTGLTLEITQAFDAVSRVQVSIAPGAFALGTPVSLLVDGRSLTGAVSNESASLVAISPTTSFDLSAQGLQPSLPVRIVLQYDPLKFAAGQDERQLHLWRYDVPSAQWTLVSSQSDATQHTLTAYTPHFSTFAPFFTAPGDNASDIHVFPQPWEITDASSRYGANVLTFSALPAQSRVRIFSITGELIFETAASSAGVAVWDGATRFGKKAGSGTYYAVFESGRQRYTRRVVLIR
jgi:hypothetical protein